MNVLVYHSHDDLNIKVTYTNYNFGKQKSMFLLRQNQLHCYLRLPPGYSFYFFLKNPTS